MIHLPVLRRSAAGALLHGEWVSAFPDPAPDPARTPASTRRTRISDIAPNLHCSIIGTCLTTGALRHFFVRLGNIPGAYRAVLTHPATNVVLAQEVFGEIHMLSHMVGSSNHLDIARLRRIEQSLAERDDITARQQARLKKSAGERAGLLLRLEALEGLVARTRNESAPPPVPVDNADTPRRRLSDEKARAAPLAARLAQSEESLRAARKSIAAPGVREKTLQAKLAAFEARLAGGGAVRYSPMTVRSRTTLPCCPA